MSETGKELCKAPCHPVLNFNDALAIREEYIRVTKIVMRYLRPAVGLDREGIVSEIILEEYSKSTKLGRSLIQWRCTDALRKLRSEQKKNHGHTTAGDIFTTNHERLGQEVGLLVQQADLRGPERLVIYHVFYQGLNLIQTGALLGISRDEAQLLLDKTVEKLKRIVRERED